MALQFPAAFDQREPEIGGSNVRFETVLLEEHPLQCFRGVQCDPARRQHRTAGDIPEDGVELGEMTVGRDFEQRHLAVRILTEKFSVPTFALQDIDFNQLVRNAQTRQRKADLVAIAGTLHRIERIHLRSDPYAHGRIESDFRNMRRTPKRQACDRTNKVWQLQGRTPNNKNTKSCSLQCSERMHNLRQQRNAGILFRSHPMCARVLDKRVVINRLDRCEVAVRDPFGARELGDVIGDCAKRQINDLAWIGSDIRRRCVHQISMEHQYRARLPRGSHDTDSIGACGFLRQPGHCFLVQRPQGI